ncbi:MAG TPA: SpoIVB peptidase S55 domain-containing protein [Planctomycetota bacterium]|nr:SpoIVB peptidase S55 domain-containing protein [Planctomycetota bacterium]HRR78738.1 SpoIVB peptidase S55 domain-containing protein [Planctomycetota bacterium]
MRLRAVLLLGVLWIALAAQAGGLPAQYLAANEIRRGMTGYGLSVFQGTRIERFDVEVIGVLRNAMPKQDIVICRMSGAGLEKTGIIAGMSGSPIYLKVGNDFKMAGAVAYGWSFPKEPICGVTPIENMYQALVSPVPEKAAAAPPAAPGGQLDGPLVLGDRSFGEVRLASAPPSWEQVAGGSATLSRLQTPLYVAGLSGPALELARREFEPLGFVLAQGGAAGAADAPEGLKLEPGSALAVRFAEGDVEMSGIGTCTDVVGDSILGFGHPMFGEGRVSVPMATAVVQFSFPSLMRSMKLASAARTVGRLTADMQAAVVGKVGAPPRMIAIETRLTRADMQGPEVYRGRLIDHPRLTSRIAGMFLANALLVRGDLPRENTLQFKATIQLSKRPPIVVDNTYSGLSSMTSLLGALNDVVNPLAALGNNEFGAVEVEKITADLQVAAEATVARVEAVRLENNECRPGDTLRALATIRPHKRDPFVQAIELKLPADFPPGSASVMVCDAQMHERLERQEAPHRYQPRDLDHLVEILREQTPQRRLYIRLKLPDRGIASRGVELPSLPASMFSVIGSPRATGLTVTGKSLSAFAETPFVLAGSHMLPLVVKPPRRP